MVFYIYLYSVLRLSKYQDDARLENISKESRRNIAPSFPIDMKLFLKVPQELACAPFSYSLLVEGKLSRGWCTRSRNKSFRTSKNIVSPCGYRRQKTARLQNTCIMQRYRCIREWRKCIVFSTK